MEQKSIINNIEKEVLNLSYYFIMGASLLVYRFGNYFEGVGLNEKGLLKHKLNSVRNYIRNAKTTLDTFDDTFLLACNGSGEKWDAYLSLANELIALNLLYISRAYNNPKDAAKVFTLLKSVGEENKEIDRLCDEYLRKALPSEGNSDKTTD